MPYIPAPMALACFPEAVRVKGKTPIPGVRGKLRVRWKDSKYIYEWDYRHGTVEKFTSKGIHLGEYDHRTGEQLKPRDFTRRIEP